MSLRTTHTYSTLAISDSAFVDILAAIQAAGPSYVERYYTPAKGDEPALIHFPQSEVALQHTPQPQNFDAVVERAYYTYRTEAEHRGIEGMPSWPEVQREVRLCWNALVSKLWTEYQIKAQGAEEKTAEDNGDVPNYSRTLQQQVDEVEKLTRLNQALTSERERHLATIKTLRDKLGQTPEREIQDKGRRAYEHYLRRHMRDHVMEHAKAEWQSDGIPLDFSQLPIIEQERWAEVYDEDHERAQHSKEFAFVHGIEVPPPQVSLMPTGEPGKYILFAPGNILHEKAVATPLKEATGHTVEKFAEALYNTYAKANEHYRGFQASPWERVSEHVKSMWFKVAQHAAGDAIAEVMPRDWVGALRLLLEFFSEMETAFDDAEERGPIGEEEYVIPAASLTKALALLDSAELYPDLPHPYTGSAGARLANVFGLWSDKSSGDPEEVETEFQNMEYTAEQISAGRTLYENTHGIMRQCYTPWIGLSSEQRNEWIEKALASVAKVPSHEKLYTADTMGLGELMYKDHVKGTRAPARRKLLPWDKLDDVTKAEWYEKAANLGKSAPGVDEGAKEE